MSEVIKWKPLTSQQKNALVARCIMGWQPKECDGWFCQKCGHDGYWGDDYGHEEIPPNYIGDWNVAWNLLRHINIQLNDKDDRYFFGSVIGGSGDGHGNMLFTIDQIAKMTPETICIAALRTKGIDLDTQETPEP